MDIDKIAAALADEMAARVPRFSDSRVVLAHLHGVDGTPRSFLQKLGADIFRAHAEKARVASGLRSLRAVTEA